MEKLMQSSRRGNLTRILDALTKEIAQANQKQKEKKEITHIFTQEDLGLLSDKGLEYNPKQNPLEHSESYIRVQDSYTKN